VDRQEMDGIALRAWSLPSGISCRPHAPRRRSEQDHLSRGAAIGGTAIGAAQAGIAQRGDVGLAAAQRPAPRADAGAKSRPLVSRLGSPRRAGPEVSGCSPAARIAAKTTQGGGAWTPRRKTSARAL